MGPVLCESEGKNTFVFYSLKFPKTFQIPVHPPNSVSLIKQKIFLHNKVLILFFLVLRIFRDQKIFKTKEKLLKF